MGHDILVNNTFNDATSLRSNALLGGSHPIVIIFPKINIKYKYLKHKRN